MRMKDTWERSGAGFSPTLGVYSPKQAENAPEDHFFGSHLHLQSTLERAELRLLQLVQEISVTALASRKRGPRVPSARWADGRRCLSSHAPSGPGAPYAGRHPDSKSERPCATSGLLIPNPGVLCTLTKTLDWSLVAFTSELRTQLDMAVRRWRVSGNACHVHRDAPHLNKITASAHVLVICMDQGIQSSIRSCTRTR